MMPRLCLFLVCVASVLFIAHGAPSFANRRSSRDLNKIDGLRARLLRLQKQINELETQEDGGKTAEVNKKTESDGATESQMTSKRQQEVQKLAKKLDEGTQTDLHTLAATLNQLLRETTSDSNGRQSNTAGEYLGDKFNTYKSRQGVAEQASQEEGVEEEEGQELQTIYNMLLRMYNRQKQGQSAVAPRTSQAAYTSEPSRKLPVPGFQVEEGSFGDFMDGDVEESRPSPSVRSRSRQELRAQVMSAIENKLLGVIQDAEDAGITVENIIADIQAKAKTQKLRQIESQLDELSRRSK